MMSSILLALAVIATTFVLVIFLDIFRSRHVRFVTLFGLALGLASLLLPYQGDVSLLRLDLFSVYFAALSLVVAFLMTLATKERTAAFYGSLLLSVMGMILAASTDNLIMLYLSIELVTAPTYVLVAYGKTKSRMEAAMKYFIVSIVASAFLLLGLGLLALDAGTTSLAALTPAATPLFLLGVCGVLTGLGFKLGMFPFNFWIPDVYQGAPFAVSGLLAGATKKAGFAAFLRLSVVLMVGLREWTLLLAVLAVLTMTVPNIIALLQKNAHRMLAYSIMMHAGFLLMGVAIVTPLSVAGALFHAFTHAVMAMGAFLVLGVFASHKLHTIEQFKGLGWRNPFLAASLSVFMLSLAGVPLLAGFASKVYLFYAVAREGWVWLTVVAILNSMISLYYYFQVLRAMYGNKPSGKAYQVRRSVTVAIVLCLLFILVFGLYPMPLIKFASLAAAALF